MAGQRGEVGQHLQYDPRGQPTGTVRGPHLAGEGLVQLDHVEVGKGESCPGQQLGDGVGGPQQQLLLGVLQCSVKLVYFLIISDR